MTKQQLFCGWVVLYVLSRVCRRFEYRIVLHCWNALSLSLVAWQVSTAVLSITAKAKKKEKEKKEKEEEKMEVVSGNAHPWKTRSFWTINNLILFPYLS